MKKTLLLVLSLTILTSCASSSKKKVEREIDEKAAQSNVSDGKTLGGTIHDLIESSKTLTEEQKQKLRVIVEENKAKAKELTEKSYKYRAVLVQELLADKVDRKKIKLIKKEIRQIEAARLKNTFQTVEKFSAIVSKHPDNKEYSDHLINFERATR